jgi:L-alanine-DL-glutamate epimerase-like enolase superfamily enzyme
MKITRIDTLRLGEFPSVVYVLVHSDEGLVGLGETFFFADAVEAHLHAVAGYLLGEDPGKIETHARALRGYVGTAASGAEMRAACTKTLHARAPSREFTLRPVALSVHRPHS